MVLPWFGSGFSSRGRVCPRPRTHSTPRTSIGWSRRRSSTGLFETSVLPLMVFSYVNRPELVDDFLKPPFTASASSVARFRYPDRAGRLRTFDWVLGGQKGQAISLPESELTVTLSEIAEFPTSTGGLDRILGDDPIPIAVFKIQAGKAEPVTHMALANLPMVPNLIPSTDETVRATQQPLASIHYMVAPTLDPKTNGRFGQIDILAGPDEALYYRVFGRGKRRHGRAPVGRAGQKGQADRRVRRRPDDANDDHLRASTSIFPRRSKSRFSSR